MNVLVGFSFNKTFRSLNKQNANWGDDNVVNRKIVKALRNSLNQQLDYFLFSIIKYAIILGEIEMFYQALVYALIYFSMRLFFPSGIIKKNEWVSISVWNRNGGLMGK